MIKTLKSGVKVEDTRYYHLLEWKDNHQDEYIKFVALNSIHTYSINEMTKEEYHLLLNHVHSLIQI